MVFTECSLVDHGLHIDFRAVEWYHTSQELMRNEAAQLKMRNGKNWFACYTSAQVVDGAAILTLYVRLFSWRTIT